MKPSLCLSLLLTSMVAFLTAGCCAPAPTEPKPLEIRETWSGSHSRSENADTVIIRTRDAWNSLWQRIGREPPRAFDPATEIAVAIFLGERRTSGYSVELVNLRSTDDTLVVEYREHVPPSGAMLAQVITSPWVVGLLPLTERRLEFASISPPSVGR